MVVGCPLLVHDTAPDPGDSFRTRHDCLWPYPLKGAQLETFKRSMKLAVPQLGFVASRIFFTKAWPS